ncbi:MAG: site-specific recombinase [Hyphomicrobiales bacterium]|nr:site-specific recombinase [Hyphomicrobiales bacterium]
MHDVSARREFRCAIYTRKSSEEGLEQDFNSLHAQREACEAYIKSQKHEGWKGLSTHYDDGGYSGGSMERPALRQLLADIEAKRIDVVVVYKVDRLTRSLADFAKIVEVFDASGVSFVSVTQAFNTTTSMGRLTLNVLLSFAQFEREVTGERIRDKVAASKRKGLWMGGFVPMGYRAMDRTLIVYRDEAETVRRIFARYLALGSVSKLEAELARNQQRTRAFTSSGNKTWGNRPFSRGHLYYLLSNPVYAGKIVHKKEQYAGQHEAIIDQKTWNAVQAQLAANTRQHKGRIRAKEPSPLSGLLVDSKGTRLTSSHATKGGRRYRYYVGTRIQQGQSKPWRLPAHEIETAVLNELRRFLVDRQRVANALGARSLKAHELKEALWTAKEIAKQIDQTTAHREVVIKLAKQVCVTETEITIEIRLAALIPDSARPPKNENHRLSIPIELGRRGGEGAIILSGSSGPETKTDPTLIKALARGFTWFEELAAGRTATVAAIARRARMTDRYVSQMIDLAFLSPRIVEKALSGSRNVRLTTKNLVFDVEISTLWAEQEREAFSSRAAVS